MTILNQTDAAKAAVTPGKATTLYLPLQNLDGTPAGRILLSGVLPHGDSTTLTEAADGTLSVVGQAPTPVSSGVTLGSLAILLANGTYLTGAQLQALLAGTTTPPTPAAPPTPSLTLTAPTGVQAGVNFVIDGTYANDGTPTIAYLVDGITGTSFTPLSGSTVSGGVLTLEIHAFQNPGTHSVQVQDSSGNTSNVVSFTVAAATPTTAISFTGAAGTQPTGTAALTSVGSNPPTGMALDGNGNLLLPSQTYAYMLFEGLGTFGDGTFEIDAAASGPQPLDIVVFLHAAADISTNTALIFQGEYGHVGAYVLGVSSGTTFPAPATFSKIRIAVAGGNLNIVVDGATLGTVTGGTSPVSGYLGIGSSSKTSPQVAISGVSFQ